jgi:chorismate-pyruvate lyase
MTHDGTLAPKIQALLAVEGSLTAALRQSYSSVQIQRLSETHQNGDWVREVLMLGDDVPIVFARTRMSSESYKRLPGLATLGDQPLGDWLFQQTHHEAISFNLRDLNTLTLTLPPLPFPPITPARERVYDVEGERISIVEIFLHADPT